MIFLLKVGKIPECLIVHRLAIIHAFMYFHTMRIEYVEPLTIQSIKFLHDCEGVRAYNCGHPKPPASGHRFQI